MVAITTHLSESLQGLAHVVLPIGSYAETSGTFVNVEGRWQGWVAAVKAVGESRPGWKVLRVLANLLNVPGFEYVSSEEVLKELQAACGAAVDSDARAALGAQLPAGAAASGEWVDLPASQADALVRGSSALAKTRDGQSARVVV